MDQNNFPTKSNLIRTKQTLALALQGYELLDQKRTVLSMEVAKYKNTVNQMQTRMNNALIIAKTALMKANISLGSQSVERATESIPIENTVQVHTISIMGVEVPQTSHQSTGIVDPCYKISETNITLDDAHSRFNEVKKIIVELAQLENTVRRLEENITKTGKRANALRHVIIPRYEARLKFMTDVLEERERDGFVRLKQSKATSENPS